MSVENLYIPTFESDLPDEFKDKYRIKVIVNAIDKQILQIAQTIKDIFSLSLDNAPDGILDEFGEKIGLTRANASAIFGLNDVYSDVSPDQDPISTYRDALKFYSLWQGMDCNYEDWHDILSEVYGVDAMFTEINGLPFTVIITLEEEDEQVERHILPSLTPPGVTLMNGVKVNYNLGMEVNYDAYTKDLLQPGNAQTTDQI